MPTDRSEMRCAPGPAALVIVPGPEHAASVSARTAASTADPWTTLAFVLICDAFGLDERAATRPAPARNAAACISRHALGTGPLVPLSCGRAEGGSRWRTTRPLGAVCRAGRSSAT